MDKHLARVNEKTMTVKEVAEVLGVSRDLVEKRINELFPGKMRRGVTTKLSEVEVTKISMRIKENSSLATSDDRRRLESMPETELEEALFIQKAVNMLQNKITTLKAKVEEDKPKVEFYDDVLNTKNAIPIGEVAKKLGISGLGPNNLFKYLRKQSVLMRDNLPYQRYIDLGWFNVVPTYFYKNGLPETGSKTLAYPKGVEGIYRLITNKSKFINGVE
jgi:phage antirepressor YoqD-like protein/predicted DNA-binding transcriptional regulator AlpA